MVSGRIWSRIALGAGLMMALGAQTCQVQPGGGLFGPPTGSYQQSCSDAFIAQGNILVAACPDERGRYVESRLRLPCQGDIANQGGQLVCRSYGGPGYGEAPDGSYRETCRDARVDGRLLTAACPDRRGRYVESSLRLPCRDDISNRDGQLFCGRDDGYGGLPEGSYRESCENARVRGDLLTAECRTRRGSYTYTQLALPCRADIANDDGQLVCGRPDYDRDVPRGSYLESCRAERVEGGWLVAECRNRYGRYVESSLSLPCRGDIGNDGGRLVCGDGYGGGGGYGGIPAGSYRQSCANVEVVRDGALLVAQCRDTTGRFVETILRLPCDGEIVNAGGRLLCGR